MATRLTKKQQTQLTEKLTGIIQKNNALQLRLSMDNSVNEMNVNQISGALNRIHGQAIGKDLPTEVNIPVKQSGSGTPSPDNVRPIVGYEIDGIGTVYGGELNIETGVLTVTYGIVDLGTLSWTVSGGSGNHFSNLPNGKPYINSQTANAICSKYPVTSGDKLSDDDYGFAIMNNTNRVGIHDKDLSGVAANDFKEAVAGVLLVYELATPETYTLTPEQMIQLLDQL